MFRIILVAVLPMVNWKVTRAQDCARAFIHAGMNAEKISKHDQAIKDFTIALECDSAQQLAYFWRGMAEANLKQHAKAIRDYDKALSLKPNDSKAYFNWGLSWEALKDRNRAIGDYTLAIKLLQRGTSQAALKKFPVAIKDYTLAIQLHPKFEVAYLCRSLARIDWGEDIYGALRDIDTAIQLSPGDSHAYNIRGRIKVLLNNFDKAVDDYTISIRLRPDDPRAYY